MSFTVSYTDCSYLWHFNYFLGLFMSCQFYLASSLHFPKQFHGICPPQRWSREETHSHFKGIWSKADMLDIAMLTNCLSTPLKHSRRASDLCRTRMQRCWLSELQLSQDALALWSLKDKALHCTVKIARWRREADIRLTDRLVNSYCGWFTSIHSSLGPG